MEELTHPRSPHFTLTPATPRFRPPSPILQSQQLRPPTCRELQLRRRIIGSLKASEGQRPENPL